MFNVMHMIDKVNDFFQVRSSIDEQTRDESFLLSNLTPCLKCMRRSSYPTGGQRRLKGKIETLYAVGHKTAPHVRFFVRL
jgi:hypothetical protein